MKLRTFVQETFRHDYTCPLCGREKFDETPFCKRCETLFAEPRLFVCPKCGRRSVSEGLCSDCKHLPPAFTHCRSFADYEPPLSYAVIKMKFHNQPFLAAPLAQKLVDVWQKEGLIADGVCFIPLHEKRLKKRGYNQSELLARHFSEATGVPIVCALTKKKESKEQRTLSREARKKNLSNCFSADKKAVCGKTLLLIDDVITTGATLDEAAATLKKAGAVNVYCLAVCATPDPALKNLQKPKKPFLSRLFKRKETK